MTGQPSFRAELERLEAVVRELERNDLDLDRALVLFEAGMRHLEQARTLLEASDRKIRQVLADADGALDDRDGD